MQINPPDLRRLCLAAAAEILCLLRALQDLDPAHPILVPLARAAEHYHLGLGGGERLIYGATLASEWSYQAGTELFGAPSDLFRLAGELRALADGIRSVVESRNLSGVRTAFKDASKTLGLKTTTTVPIGGTFPAFPAFPDVNYPGVFDDNLFDGESPDLPVRDLASWP